MKLAPWRRMHGCNGGEDATGLTVARFRDELITLFDRFLDDSWSTGDWKHARAAAESFPSVDVVESEDHVTVRMKLPGVQPQDLDIRLDGNRLTVRGEEKQDLQCVEGHFSGFYRSMQLPSSVFPDSTEATFKNGVLEIVLTKRLDVSGKRIFVKNT